MKANGYRVWGLNSENGDAEHVAFAGSNYDGAVETMDEMRGRGLIAGLWSNRLAEWITVPVDDRAGRRAKA